MSAPIFLENTVLDFKQVVEKLPMASFCTWTDGEAKLTKVVDFGIVFVGEKSLTEAAWLAQENPTAPTFVIPEGWLMAHCVKALGAFESVSQAKKNGWEKPVPDGISFHPLRINRLKGMLTVMKVAA